MTGPPAGRHSSIQNRMGDKPELGGVRASSEKPSLWTRTGRKWVARASSSAAVTFVLAFAIIATVATGLWILL